MGLVQVLVPEFLSLNIKWKHVLLFYGQGNASNICSHCLPDCQLTTYSAKHTAVQFRLLERDKTHFLCVKIKSSPSCYIFDLWALENVSTLSNTLQSAQQVFETWPRQKVTSVQANEYLSANVNTCSGNLISKIWIVPFDNLIKSRTDESKNK